MGPLRSGRGPLLLFVAVAGALIFLIGLGQTGVIDETPALFAASARRMRDSGNWLVPWVNGLTRYDKPPLVYWLMAAGYALPGQSLWDPLGSLAARLPSALASITVMLALADTLMRWPQTPPSRRGAESTALNASLAFALGPLALVWGRTEVSDGLFSALLAISLLLAWRTYAAGAGPHGSWWPPLALAILTKGPVALVLWTLTPALFALLQADLPRIVQRLRPARGLLLAGLSAAPWYGAVLWHEGAAYGRSFFGYHNLQRFTQVVNNHHQPWWYYGALLLVASLPYTPLLLLGLKRALVPRSALPPECSLARIAACWLLVVLVFFSISATKLPSYWLPATPAAALLVALAAGQRPAEADRGSRSALTSSAVLLLLLAAVLAAAPLWVPWIEDPSVPDLPTTLLRGPWFGLGASIALAAALLAGGIASRQPARRLLQSQLVLILLVPLLLLPLAQQLDLLRGAPIRELAAAARRQRQPGETLAMVGLMKPSLHFYSGATVIFEGRSASALRNLADRLHHEQRPQLLPSTPEQQPTVLVVIDRTTANRPHWLGWQGGELAAAGHYQLLRLKRDWLEHRSQELGTGGARTTWRDPRPERY
jgi:4-amino-4-deoxy-L-arabinose transferase-like glycosyltransferase